MSRKLLALATAVAFSGPVALADTSAGEKKAELCMFCHRQDNSHAAPILDGLPTKYLLRQFEFYKSGKRFGPAMQTNLGSLSAEDWHEIADYFSSRPAISAVTSRPSDEATQELGSKIARELGCSHCHGDDYRGMKELPRLAGQLRSYLALHMGRLQRDSSLHPPLSSGPVPQGEIEAMATFFASLLP